MKYIKYILVIIFAFLLIGCVNLNDYIPIEEHNFKLSELEESNIIIDNNAIEIAELQKEVDISASRLDLSNIEIEKYNNLINNLDEYLSYVYPMKVSNDNYSSDGMGFTIEYWDKLYLITTGHGVHYVFEDYDVLYTNFKVGIDNNWIYLELLDYDNNYINKADYAILTSNEIDSGFDVDLDNDRPLFLIGGNRLMSDYSRKTVEGESGLPVIDIDGEVTEIATTDLYYYNTDIDIILQAIDNLE